MGPGIHGAAVQDGSPGGRGDELDVGVDVGQLSHLKISLAIALQDRRSLLFAP